MNDGGGALAALESRIGHAFDDRSLLLTAVTHASSTADGRAAARTNYQRFEFLGDRVLGLVVAGMLLDTFPHASEGELSSRLAELVRKETCAEVATDLDLGAAMVVGGNKAQRRALQTTNVLGDVCESVIAAIYLDGGLDAARTFIEAHWRKRMLAWQGSRHNAKAALQEWAQARGYGMPSYRIVGRSGPEHALTFTIAVTVDTLPEGVGDGNSRREAEQAAASAVLAREGAWPKSA